MYGLVSLLSVSGLPGEFVALGAALTSSAGYVSARRGLSDASPEALVTVTTAVSVVVLIPLALVTGQVHLTPEMIGVFVVSGLLGSGLGRFLISNAIEMVGSGIAHAVKSASPVAAVIFSVILLGETLTPLLAVGVLTVAIGLIVLTWSGNEGNPTVDSKTTALISLVIVVWFGVTPVIRKFGLSELGAPVIPALAVNFAAGLGVGLVISLQRDPGQLRALLSGATKWYLVITGVFWTTAIATYFLALSLADAVVVVPIFNSSPLFTVALGLLVFQDARAPTLATLAGAVVTVVGVILITVA